MSAKLIERNVEVPLADIEIGPRLRPASEAGVDALEASYDEMGVMKDAVQLRRKKKSGQLVLMAGLHRVMLGKRKGWETIRCDLWECTDDWARLMEIDDNLAGAELTALDTAIFLAERKAVYERLHPEAKAMTGAELVAKRWDTADMMSVVSFAAATAEKMGATERHVRRLVAAGAALTKDHQRWLRSAPKPVSLADLLALSKVTDEHERAQICIALSNGAAKSAADAIRQRQTDRPVKDPVEEAFKSLRQAWARAPKAARRRFVEAEYGDLIGVVHDFEEDNADFGAEGVDG